MKVGGKRKKGQIREEEERKAGKRKEGKEGGRKRRKAFEHQALF